MIHKLSDVQQVPKTWQTTCIAIPHFCFETCCTSDSLWIIKNLAGFKF